MIKNFSGILRDLIDNVGGRGRVTDFNIGSVARTLLEAVAAVIEELYYWLELFTSKFFIATSEGEWLERRLADFGLNRKPGAKAGGTIIIGRDTHSPISIFIPAGTVFVTDEGLEFETTANASLDIGGLQVPVPAQAKETGKSFNLLANTVLKQAGVAIAGLEWGKIDQMGGGIDRETDEELKARVTPYFNSLGRSTKAAIEFAAMSVAGVSAVTIKENDPGPGWFKVYIDDGSGSASAGLIAAVADAVERYRGFCVRYLVATPTVVWQTVAADCTVLAEYNAAIVRAEAKTAVIAYINSLTMGQQVYKAQLYRVITSVTGVDNVQISAPSTDTSLAADEIARTDGERVIVA